MLYFVPVSRTVSLKKKICRLVVTLVFLLTCGNIENSNPYLLEGKHDYVPYSDQ